MFGSALEINTNEFSEYVRIHCMHTFDVATIDGLSFDIYTRIINSFQESQHSANVDQAYLWYRLNSRCSLKETRNTKLPTEMRSVHVFDFFAVKSSQATRWCLRSAGSALFDSFLCRQVESTIGSFFDVFAVDRFFLISSPSTRVEPTRWCLSFWNLQSTFFLFFAVKSSQATRCCSRSAAVHFLISLPSSRVVMVLGSPFFDFFAVGESRRHLQFLCCRVKFSCGIQQRVWQKCYSRSAVHFLWFLSRWVESSRVAMVVGSPFFDFFAVVESRRCLQLTVRDFFFAVESSSGVDVEQNVWQKPIIMPWCYPSNQQRQNSMDTEDNCRQLLLLLHCNHHVTESVVKELQTTECAIHYNRE